MNKRRYIVLFTSLFLSCMATSVAAEQQRANDPAPAGISDRPPDMKAAPSPKPRLTLEQTREDQRNLGYIRNPMPRPECEILMSEMKTRFWRAIGNKWPINLKTVGYMKLEDYDGSTYRFHIPEVEERLIKPGSRNYIAPGEVQAIRIYTDTVFGALMIQQLAPADFEIYDTESKNATFTIGGNLATASIQKHTMPNKWATRITAYDGKEAFLFESNRRLEGEDFDAFIRFAKNLVENG